MLIVCKMNCYSTKRDLSVVGFCCSIYLYHESTDVKANDAYCRRGKDDRLYGVGQSIPEEFCKIFKIV